MMFHNNISMKYNWSKIVTYYINKKLKNLFGKQYNNVKNDCVKYLTVGTNV